MKLEILANIAKVSEFSLNSKIPGQNNKKDKSLKCKDHSTSILVMYN